MRRERVGRHRAWISFLLFCCSSNVIAPWFRLHNCMYCVRHFFGAHPKMRAATFDYLHIVLTRIHFCLYLVASPSQLATLVFTLSHLAANWLLNPTRRLTSAWCRKKDISVFGPFISAQMIRDLCFFLSFLDTVVIHPWLADLQQVLWRYLPEVSWPFCIISVRFFFFFFSLLPQKSTSRRFLTSTLRISLHLHEYICLYIYIYIYIYIYTHVNIININVHMIYIYMTWCKFPGRIVNLWILTF